MSKDNKLPPKVETFIKEASAQLKEQDALVKRAEDAEAKVAELEKTAANADTSAADEAVTKLAEETANVLLADGVIAAEHRAKFAADLVEPAKAHTLLRNLGKKIASVEATAQPPRMGGPADDAQRKSASDEGSESADDRFSRRVRQASGV